MKPAAKKKTSSGKKKSRGSLSGSSWSSGTWIGLLVFISVWMFIFGILVGRGTLSTPFKYNASQKELYAMAEKAAKEEKKKHPIPEMTDKIDPDPFDELKNSSRGESKKDDLLFATTKKPKTVPSAPPRLKKPQENKVIPKKQPPPVRKVRPKSVPVPTAPAVKPKRATIKSTHRTVQAASMQSLNEAKRMVARLRKKGYKAYVASAAVAGKGVQHRVRIGPFKNVTDADTALKQLKKDGIKGIMLK